MKRVERVLFPAHTGRWPKVGPRGVDLGFEPVIPLPVILNEYFVALTKRGGSDVFAKCRNPHEDFRRSLSGGSGQLREIVFTSADKLEDEFAELW